MKLNAQAAEVLRLKFDFNASPVRSSLGFTCKSKPRGAKARFIALLLGLAAPVPGHGAVLTNDTAPLEPDLVYTNYRVASVPWSIHVVRIKRSDPALEIHSGHAGGGALGLSTLSDQIKRMDSSKGVALAAINGDFYKRDGFYAGDPRGVQVIDGELISAPVGGACFWIDALGQPLATNVGSLFQVVWPNGATNSFGLNEERPPRGMELYTPAIGASTHTSGGRELILEGRQGSPWLPLRIGRAYQARVREIRESGDTKLEPGLMILSLGPALLAGAVQVSTGAVLSLSLATTPTLRGARAAIGGGPVLLRNGKRQKLEPPSTESYEFSSMMERHPRTAIGWNPDFFFFVEVDGRQKDISVGMTLDELSRYLAKLGCEDAMNLDGDKSATLWSGGAVRNSPCDGRERAIANSLIVVKRQNAGSRKPAEAAGRPQSGSRP